VSIALKEARETRYWLALVDATILSNDPEVQALLQESTELTKILFTIIANARKNRVQ
jgi:four helix bundle protein